MIVLFLTSVPFIRQHENDMYVQAISADFETELWECSRIYGRNSDAVSDLAKNRLIIYSLEQLHEELKRVIELFNNACIITNILNTKLAKIYQTIKEYHIPIFNIDKENLANWLAYKGLANDNHSDSLRNKISAIIMNSNPLRKLYKLVKRGGVKYDVVFSGYNYYPEDNKKFVKTHNVKYDEYLRAKQSDNIVGENYIVFLDAALANHPMFANSSRRPLNIDKYLEDLNLLFDRLEKKYKMRVVISAHPKSDYKESDFGGRFVFKYKTPELLQHCTYVVSHYSTSLVDAVLLYKPILVLKSEDLITSATRKSVLMGTEFASLLSLPVIDLDCEYEPTFSLDRQCYDEFISEHIINPDRIDCNNSDIIIEYLESMKGV